MKDLACSVFAENLRFNVCRSYLEPSAQMHAKAQAVEQRAGRENAFMTGQFACQIGKRIRRVSDDEQNSVRRGCGDRRNYLTVDLCILFQEAQAA
ncbi:hypothetical protein [Bradyrhizobium cenepequi]|uniref:hypothetical protein n=1 Tax=Bradyrhizobium cenepequi TaxID=2821403 RepID=UPI001CE36D34|nr:hypothetical protein [Bradyrhizobium cenepequi]MCA6109324.1 hypothetical protein [Bradyrhizobium cenepequi]